jgi:hypothetical protein
MSDPKRLRIRIGKEVNSRIWVRYYLKVRTGSEIDWKVGSRSGSKINNFGSATCLSKPI